MPVWLAIIVVGAIGYALGSIQIAQTVARRCGIDDLRRVGDRNPGFWNARELLGTRAALPVFVGDVAKGALAATVGMAPDGGEWWLTYLGAGAAMIGHAFPLWAGFRGGRSVLAFVGGMAVAAPGPAAIAIGAAVICFATVRRFDWAARLGIIAFPIAQLLVEDAARAAATGLLMTFIGIRFATAEISARTSARARHDGAAAG